jgi:hypothetical protein
MSKAIRAITKPISRLGPVGDILTAIALTAAGQPQLIPIVQGVKTYGQTGNVLSGLAAGAGSYLGGKFGGKVFGDLGSIGGLASNALGPETASSIFGGIGNTAGNAAASGIFNAPISSLAGSYAGNTLGTALVGAPDIQDTDKPAGFVPKRAGDSEAPASLQGYGSLNPQQQSSNLATQGVYGGGLGPQEQQYFLNLVNRQLIPEQGGMNDVSSLNPIENSYLSQLGLGGYSNSNDLLEAIGKWKAA